jgi:hypothetical protein|tara:strand:- start:1148 stop:1939 length:792 start_codon:yes stop_codon:yes gene_type:complete
MPTITFHANNNDWLVSDHSTSPDTINHTAGSGLGFFGGGFGISVPVGEYQTSTYVTNAAGTASGVRCSNIKYVETADENTCLIQSSTTPIGVSGIPNFQAPLNIRFEHDDAAGVRVQNCKLRIFDRNDINTHAVGVTTQVYEIRHPNPTEGVDYDSDIGPLKFRGEDDVHQWSEYTDGTAMADLVMTPGPGPSGLNTSGDETRIAEDSPGSNVSTAGGYTNYIARSGNSCRATRHDWYVALSASPDSIGSKTDFGLYFTLEYL